MTDRSERAVLNHLIETCRDAEHGFRAAADCVADVSLKLMLLELAAQRARFAVDLLPHAQRLGGATDGEGTAAAAVHRSWINLRHSIARHDDGPVVKEAERGEQFALSVYKSATESLLPPDVRDVVETQYAELRQTTKRLQAFEHPVHAGVRAS